MKPMAMMAKARIVTAIDESKKLFKNQSVVMAEMGSHSRTAIGGQC